LIATLAAAIALVLLENHYAKSASPTGLGKLIAGGSSPATAWPGWIAAAFFLLSIFRLRGGSPEPPTGSRPLEQLSVTEIRRGFISEYRAVRVSLCIVTALAVVDVERFAGIGVEAVRHASWAGGALLWSGIEAAGWVGAAVLLAAWALTFRGQLEQWGAV
jgi:hypothetical protein